MPITWSIETQVRKSDLGPGGRYVPGWEIGYVTSTGVHGSVFVPDTEYTADNVAAIISARVGQVVEVHRLSGQVD